MVLNNFKSNLEYDPLNPKLTDDSGNYLNEMLYTNINLVEQFNPLLKVDMIGAWLFNISNLPSTPGS